jgi:hypothetical protein
VTTFRPEKPDTVFMDICSTQDEKALMSSIPFRPALPAPGLCPGFCLAHCRNHSRFNEWIIKLDKTFYIHAGLPKTGTSSIQTFFFNNADKIDDACDFHYLKTGLNSKYGHFHLFPIKDDIWQGLSKEAGSHQNKDLLASWEGCLDTFPTNQTDFDEVFDKIVHYVPDHKIKFIVYFRHLSDYSKSIYNQYIKYKLVLYKNWSNLPEIERHRTFSLITEIQSDYHESLLTEFDRTTTKLHILNAIVNRCGRDNVIIRPYDKKLLKDNNIVADFLDVIGLDISDLDLNIDYHENTNIPNNSLSLFKELYSSHQHFNYQVKIDLGNKIHKHYTSRKNADIDRDIDWGKVNSLIDEFEELMPGYKAFFADNPCSFNFHEIDMEPETRLTFDFLFELYAKNEALLEELKSLGVKVETVNNSLISLRAINFASNEMFKNDRLNLELKNNALNNTLKSLETHLELKNDALNDTLESLETHLDLKNDTLNNALTSLETHLKLGNDTLSNVLKNIENKIEATDESLQRLWARPQLDVFPNFSQYLILQAYRLFCRLFRSSEVYQRFLADRRGFVAGSRRLRRILRIFGPTPASKI